MFWTDEDRKQLFSDLPEVFAEVAHEYPCCDVPTLKGCYGCRVRYCFNRESERFSNYVRVRMEVENG